MNLVPLVLLALAQHAPTLPAADPLVGTVEDADGKPVAGIEVLLTSGLPPSGERPRIGRGFWKSKGLAEAGERHPVLGRGRTDAEGRFRLEVPAEVLRSQEPLPVALWSYRPGGRVASRRLPWATPAPAEPVRLVLGPPATGDLRVLGPDGTPAAGLRLVVTALDRLAVPEELAEQAAVETGPDGVAVVSAFGPGEIRGVTVVSSKFGGQDFRIPMPDASGARTLTLKPVGRVSGRVRTDDGKSAAGLKVRARTAPEGIDLGGTIGAAETTIDESGRFEFPAIAAGRLSLTLDFHDQPELAYRGQPPADQVVEAGQATTLEIALKRAVRLRGLVRERGNGAPIPGVRLLIPDLVVARLGGDPAVETDAGGRFAGSMQGEQPYAFLDTSPRPYFYPADAPDTTYSLPAGATEYTLPPIELVRGVGLRGTVVDEAGTPMPGALVRASWEGKDTIPQSLAGRTDPRGAFLLEGLDPLADLRLTARSEGASTAAPLTARAGLEKPVTLRVGRANAVALVGRVIDAAGKPVEGAEVTIRSLTRNARGQVWRSDPVTFDDRDALRTDAEGRFRTPRAVPRDGEYEASVRARGMLPRRTSGLKPGGGEAAAFADVALRRLRAVEGLVRDRQGQPVPGATVLQSGDGPTRTRATTDDRGRFRLAGFIEGTAILFARKDGFRFHGQPIDTEAGAAELVLTRADEPAATLKTLDSVLPRDEEWALARRLLGPYAEKVAAEGDDGEKFQALAGLAVVDAGRALEMLERGVISDQGLKDSVRSFVAGGLAAEAPEEAVSVAESIQDPGARSWSLTDICDKLPGPARARKLELLAQAQLQARGVQEPGARLRMLGRVADRWLELGETARAEALLREGRALAREVPPPGYERVAFAEPLARVDLPAALALIDTARQDAGRGDRSDRVFVFDRSYGEIAYRLAERDPAGAERVLGLIVDPYRRGGYVSAACARMAARDLPRARRLADSIDDPLLQAYALGLMARTRAHADLAAAVRLLAEAFARLEEHRDGRQGRSEPACVAAVLLGAVEQVDPTRLQESVWRAVALRAPRPDERGEGANEQLDADLAMNLARYDRAAAAAVLAPALAPFGSSAAGVYGQGFIAMAEVLIDPRRAVDLVEGLPDEPSFAPTLPKNQARRLVAEMLSKHGDARWQTARQWGVSIWRPEGSDL